MPLKRLIKRSLGPLSSVLSSNFAPGVHGVILCYHGIDTRSDKDTVEVNNFKSQLMLLNSEFEVVDLDRLIFEIQNGGPSKRPKPLAAITFDDGYKNLIQFGLPILKEFSMPATAFVVAGLIGKARDWNPGPHLSSNSLFDPEDLRTWVESGMTIGSHGMTHSNFLNLSRDAQRKELMESRKKLTSLLRTLGSDNEVRGFSYPFGMGRRERDLDVQEAGYTYALRGVYATRHSPNDILSLKRIYIGGNDSISDFRMKIHGGCDWLGYFKT